MILQWWYTLECDILKVDPRGHPWHAIPRVEWIHTVKIPMPSLPLPHRLLRSLRPKSSGLVRLRSQIPMRIPQLLLLKAWALAIQVTHMIHMPTPHIRQGQGWSPHKESIGLRLPASPLYQPPRPLTVMTHMPSLPTHLVQDREETVKIQTS